MFIVTLDNNGIITEIHGEREKLTSGKVVKGINTIDTFTFTMLPYNPGFDAIRDFVSLVKVYNTNKQRYEFYGRVLYSDTAMDESGLITKSVTCESYFGYLCDSWQLYVAEQNWTVSGLLSEIIGVHNEFVEPEKQFAIGEITVTDPNDNVYCGIQRENTWDALKNKLLNVLGGEFRFRVENGTNYIDYLSEIGQTRETEIAVAHNMKSITQEKDPSAYVTRLIPYGCKLQDAEGNDTEERLDISSVNGGLIYLDDVEARDEYGIHVGQAEWDDVTDPAHLKSKGEAWLAENNKIKIKYSVTALDLSLLGLDVDDFEVCDYYPIKNALIGVDDVARIIKKTIDVCEEVRSTLEFGENFKALSDIQMQTTQQAASSKTALEAEITALKQNTTEKFIETDGRIEELEKAGLKLRTDDTLTLTDDGLLYVNTADNAEADNTLPITSAAVYAEIGNIDALLETI